MNYNHALHNIEFSSVLKLSVYNAQSIRLCIILSWVKLLFLLMPIKVGIIFWDPNNNRKLSIIKRVSIQLKCLGLFYKLPFRSFLAAQFIVKCHYFTSVKLNEIFSYGKYQDRPQIPIKLNQHKMPVNFQSPNSN